MSDSVKEMCCRQCATVMEEGYATASGLLRDNPLSGDPTFTFVVPGQATSVNPIKAFQQGLHGERASEAYLLRGHRCPTCGTVELFATERVPWGAMSEACP